MGRSIHFWISLLFFIVTGLIVFVLLLQRFDLSLVRFFDVDEYAYLHWAHNIFAGQVPIRDFFQYVSPGFPYVLAPMYYFYAGTAAPIAARVITWALFCVLAVALGMLFVALRGEKKGLQGLPLNAWIFLLPMLFLVFLPLPADKFLEIRPDTTAFIFAVLGLWCQVRAMRSPHRYSSWVYAGIWYGVSVLMLQKAIPQVVFSVILACGWAIDASHASRRTSRGAIAHLLVGVSIPLLFLLSWTVATMGIGGVLSVFYSLITLPFEVNRMGQVFIIEPSQFFYPNEIFYGYDGWNRVLLANHLVWICGIFFGLYRLCTPLVARGREGMWAELLVAGSMIIHIMVFMFGYSLRHAQYLIPVAIFVAFYAADLVNHVREHYWRRWGVVLFMMVYSVILIGVYTLNLDAHKKKITYTNAAQLRSLHEMIRVIPSHAYVLDLTGATIYFRDPYYVSAIPFGQWDQFVSRPLGSLTQSLEKTKAHYIYKDHLGRLQSLSDEERMYIARNYRVSPDVSYLLVRSN